MNPMAELVFIHGAGDSAAVWERQREHFAAHHTLLMLDLPGHGQRIGEQAHESHEKNADEVARQIRDHRLNEPMIVGHSMGGGVALLTALRHPSSVRALVLVASGARLRMHPSLIERARQKAQGASATQIAGPAAPLEQAISPHASAEDRAWLEERVGQATGQATYADFLANDNFDVMERLADIRQPALVLAGEDDQMTPPKFQRFLAERLPGAELVLLPHAGHYVHVEQAEAFNDELERFLADLERR